MPIISHSTYKPPFLLRNGHLATIYSSLLRTFDPGFYRRERIGTPDGDFLDLDWSQIGCGRLAILSHGLEGSSHRSYMMGMAKALNRHGWDALAWNFRGCGGEINRKLRFYHSGATEDLHCVINHVLLTKKYEEIALIGFSMGGNLTLVYLGREAKKLPGIISKAVAFSVPCDLRSGSLQMAKVKNKIYMKRFLRMLHKKVVQKMTLMPEKINDDDFHTIKNFKDFDDRYTAPIHGFKNAEDYWRQCSSKKFLANIEIPTLIVNAENDPFLGPECYPFREAEKSKAVFLEVPRHGGHVGFVSFNKAGTYWSEQRAIEFLNRDE